MNVDQIINFFDNDEEIKFNEIKILKYNETENFDKIYKFTNYFKNNLYRYGSLQFDKKCNISFLFSVLLLLDDEFTNMLDIDQKKYIKAFKNRILLEVTKLKLLTEINLKGSGWNKKNLHKLLSEDIIDDNYIYYIATYFNINIFIFDLTSEEIYSYYNDELFNKYKTNIFISKFEDTYEAIIYVDGKTTFIYTDNVLNKLIEHETILVNIIGFTKKKKIKEFIIDNNIKLKIDNIIDDKLILSDDKNTTEHNTFCIITADEHPTINVSEIESEDYNVMSINTEFSNTKEYSIEELLKKSKKELVNICKDMRKPYSNKNKKQLAELINK